MAKISCFSTLLAGRRHKRVVAATEKSGGDDRPRVKPVEKSIDATDVDKAFFFCGYQQRQSTAPPENDPIFFLQRQRQRCDEQSSCIDREIISDNQKATRLFVQISVSQENGTSSQPATRARLAIGSAVAVPAPFVHSKWASFLRIQSEVDMVKDMAETAAEVVEDVAAAAEKVSAEVSGQLPEDGRLKHAAVLVEHASKEVAEEARLAQDIIHKVDEIEEEVKAIIEPIIDHGKRERK